MKIPTHIQPKPAQTLIPRCMVFNYLLSLAGLLFPLLWTQPVLAQDTVGLSPFSAWTSGASQTTSVVWGDVDGDGDLDLAVGNFWGANEVYLNHNGELETIASWTSSDSSDEHAMGMAWGDVDGDGDLDLAAGNVRYDSKCECTVGGANKVYLNQNGVLETNASWTSADEDFTRSVAWGDIDGDGDLDLAVGNDSVNNHEGVNKVYLNQGGIQKGTLGELEVAAWTFGDKSARTFSVAWGDVDGDGDLDLATGNNGQANKVYLNQNGRLGVHRLLDLR